MADRRKNQGEGNREAARDYNDRTRDFVRSGHVEERAQEAKRALEGAERDELEAAERIGKSHGKGEDPVVKR